MRKQSKAIKWVFSLSLLSLLFMVGCQSNPSKPSQSKALQFQIDGKPIAAEEKQILPIQLFSVRETLSIGDVKSQVASIAERVATTAVKRAKLEINGPLTLVFENQRDPAITAFDADVGFPIKGKSPNLPGYQTVKKDAFKCLSVELPAEEKRHGMYWQSLAELAVKEGYKPSGESRSIIHQRQQGYVVELQLGVL